MHFIYQITDQAKTTAKGRGLSCAGAGGDLGKNWRARARPCASKARLLKTGSGAGRSHTRRTRGASHRTRVARYARVRATVLRPAPAPARHRRRGFDRASGRAQSDRAGGPLDGENISEFKTPFFNDRGLDADASTSDPVRLFCLDRDGVINKDVGVPGVVDVDDFELLPEARARSGPSTTLA